MNLRKILVTTDFSENATEAFAPAAALARRSGGKIFLVNVGGGGSPFGLAARGVSSERGFFEGMRDRLEELARDPRFGGVCVEPVLLDGAGPERVDAFQRDVGHDLLVTSTRGLSGIKRVILGSFAERLVQLMGCPVLTYRTSSVDGDFAPRRVLLPIDFSDLSRPATSVAKVFATEPDAEFLLANFLDQDAVTLPDFALPSRVASEIPGYWEKVAAEAKQSLLEFASKELGDRRFVTAVVPTGPIPGIVEQARKCEADLIVMSTHGRSGIQHALIGSVAERVVRSAPCSVLTIRPCAYGPPDADRSR